MGDRNVDNARAAAARLRDDEHLRKRIVAYAWKVTGNRADMRDLAQEAMARAIDPARSPWDPAKQPDLFLYLGSIINGIVRNRRRAEERHPVDLVDPKDVSRPDPRPSVLQRMIQEEENALYEFWLEMLIDRLAGDTVALDVLRLLQDGLDGAAQHAAKLQRQVEEIYAANRRIAYHADHVKKDYPNGRASNVQGVSPRPKLDGGPAVDG